MKNKLKNSLFTRQSWMMGCLVLLVFSCSQEEIFEENVLGTEDDFITASLTTITIQNPGFESGKSKWGNHSRYSISNDEHSGSNAAKVSSSTGRIRQTVTVAKNTDYELKAWVKGDGRLSIGGSTRTFDTNNYTQISVAFNSGNATSATILGKRDSGDARFDDFTLQTTGSNDGGNDGGNDENLALGRATSQSSTRFGGSASRAVDGNTSGVWSEKSVTHTNKTNRPWWEVNLGSNQDVEQIKIWNRTNCCSNRLNNFDVLVYNTSGNEVFKRTITSTPNPSVTINTGGVSGSRVRVRLNGTEFLSLAEVQVFGEPGNDDSGGNDNPDDGGGSGSAAAIIGGMNSHWKLNGFSGSLNVGSGSYGRDGSNGLDYEDRASINDNNNWFFDTNGYAAFKCHVGNPTSSGSGNMRSELRELDGDGDEIEWDGTTNTNHRMRYKVQVRQLPSSGKLCFGQIHGQGNFDDVIRLQLEDTSVTDNDRQNDTSGAGSGTHAVTIKGYVTEVLDRDNRNNVWATMQMDKEYDVEIAMRDEIVTVKLNGSTIYTSKKVNSKDNYFKAGAYLQSSQSDKSPQLRRHNNNFGETWIKNMVINH